MFELIDFIIVRPITNILFVVYSLVGDFGLAIIIFTILVKLCMWPLVKRQLRQTNPDVEKSIFNSIHTVTLDTFPGWKIHGESHSYLEEYDLWPNTFQGMMKQKGNE